MKFCLKLGFFLSIWHLIMFNEESIFSIIISQLKVSHIFCGFFDSFMMAFLISYTSAGKVMGTSRFQCYIVFQAWSHLQVLLLWSDWDLATYFLISRLCDLFMMPFLMLMNPVPLWSKKFWYLLFSPSLPFPHLWWIELVMKCYWHYMRSSFLIKFNPIFVSDCGHL